MVSGWYAVTNRVAPAFPIARKFVGNSIVPYYHFFIDLYSGFGSALDLSRLLNDAE